MASRILVVLGATLALLAAADARPSDRKMLVKPAASLKGKAIVIHQELQDQTDSRLLAVLLQNGQQVEVQVSDERQLDGLVSGMNIQVTGQWEQPQRAQQTKSAAAAATAGALRFAATAIRASAAPFAAPKLTAVGGSATSKVGSTPPSGAHMKAATMLSTNRLITPNINAIFIPIGGMSAPGVPCPSNRLPRFTVDQVKQAIFEELNPNNVTVGSTYNKCSYGKTKLTTSNSLVADLVELPCTGTTTKGNPWTMSKCTFKEYNAWSDAADEVLKARGIDLSKYKYRIYLLPPGVCSFVGMGYIGCDASITCRTWLGPDFWTNTNAITHELGHNLFMAHAGATKSTGSFDEYGDKSGTMGYCCSNRCPNTPHAWQMGWISVQQLNGNTLAAGQTVTTALSSQSISARSGLRITASWAAGVDPIFVGYRTKAGGDLASTSEETFPKVHVYTAPITNTFDPRVSTWKAGLSTAGESWTHPTAGVVVRLGSTSRTSAVVSVCRIGGAETVATCQAGTDNDCNGLAGAGDPACVALLQRAAAKAA